jgi:hypothetical protein
MMMNRFFPYHIIKGTAYFEGSGKKTQELWINGQKKFAFVVNAQKPIDFEIPIPLELYKQTHKVNLSIKNPQGTGVYLADLKVYRLTDSKPLGGGGGPQSSGEAELQSQNLIILTPNPFKDKLTIELQLSMAVESGLVIKVFDAAGRLVRQLDRKAHESIITWQGDDDKGHKLPNGIYFLQIKLNDELITKKALIVR